MPAGRVQAADAMPVRFHCPICQQLLGVASRKVGSQVTCPKCLFEIVVPDGKSGTESVTPPDKSAAKGTKPPGRRGVDKPGTSKISAAPPSGKPTAGRSSQDSGQHDSNLHSDYSLSKSSALWISDSMAFDDIPAVLASAPVPQPAAEAIPAASLVAQRHRFSRRAITTLFPSRGGCCTCRP